MKKGLKKVWKFRVVCVFNNEYDFKALVRMDKEISLKDRLERVEAVLQEVNISF